MLTSNVRININFNSEKITHMECGIFFTGKAFSLPFFNITLFIYQDLN